jgi:serine/threonine protein kinase
MGGHPNIVQAYGVCVDQGRFYIILEYCKGGSVSSQFGKSTLSPDRKLRIACDVASGLAHLHSSGMLHCDVSCRNFLIKGDHAKLTDFGLTQSANSRESMHKKKGDNILGPVRWSAPEALANSEFSTATDVWMFACALVELYGERPPFAGMDDTQAAVAVMAGHHPEIPGAAPPKIADLCNRCWQLDPRLRPSMADVANELGQIIGDLETQDLFDSDWDPRWIVKKRDIQFVRELGKGQYGAVWEGRWKQSRVAIKEARDLPLHEKHGATDPLADLRKEARLMLSLRPHSNVVATFV